MQLQEDKRLDVDPQEQDSQLPRLSSITFNIASGYDQQRSPAENIIQANRFIVHQISQAVAKINRTHFRKKLQPVLQEHGNYIKQSQIALIDNYGRATFFYCRLANQIIPFYQPGTIMFESAVKQNSRLNVTAHGGQQNGPLLGNGCAIFLAKFFCNLIACYQRVCAVSYQDCHHFFPNIYKKALKETLFNLGIQDAKEHGRLVTMQETLLGLGGDKMKKDDDDLIRLFHIKDISQIEGRSIDQVGSETDCPLSYYQYKQIANMRQKDMYYSETAGLYKGKCIAERTLEEYQSGLMVKSGLVPPDNDQMFKLQMVALIKQIQESSQNFKNNMIVKSQGYDASKGIFQKEKDKSMIQEYEKQKSQKHSLSGTASQNQGDISDPPPSTVCGDSEKYEIQSGVTRSTTRSSALYTLFSQSVEDDEDDVVQDQLGRQWLAQAIQKNQRIKNYYNSLLSDVEQILQDGEISRSGGFHYSNMKLNQIFVELGHFTPMLGSILHVFGLYTHQLENSDIKKRLDKICALVPSNIRRQTAQRIVTEIIVGRREFLQTMQNKYIRKIIRKLDDWRDKSTKMTQMLQQEILVEVDSRSIQCIMIGLPYEKFQKIYIDQKRMNALVNDMTDAFFNPQPVSTITGNLSADEKPINFKRGVQEFELNLDLFQQYKKELPTYMKRQKGESAIEHQKRCEEFLINVGQEHFDRLGMISDPNSPRRKNLFLIYSNALKARKKKDVKKKKGKCAVF